VNPEGIEFDRDEMATFAVDAQALSDGAQGVVTATEPLHLGHSVLGVVGRFFTEDADGTLASVLTDMRTSVADLAADAEAARAMVTELAEAEDDATNNFTRTDLP
jgi:hypothetical protein